MWKLYFWSHCSAEHNIYIYMVTVYSVFKSQRETTYKCNSSHIQNNYNLTCITLPRHEPLKHRLYKCQHALFKLFVNVPCCVCTKTTSSQLVGICWRNDWHSCSTFFSHCLECSISVLSPLQIKQERWQYMYVIHLD